jgi:hypothetical protein
MRCPVGVGLDLAAGARIDLAERQLFHGDAILDRADVDAKVAGHALIVLDAERPVFAHLDRLVRGVFAGGIAAAALDAEILVDHRLGDVVEVEVFPVLHLGHSATNDFID